MNKNDGLEPYNIKLCPTVPSPPTLLRADQFGLVCYTIQQKGRKVSKTKAIKMKS